MKFTLTHTNPKKFTLTEQYNPPASATLTITDPYNDIIKIQALSSSVFRFNINKSLFYRKKDITDAIDLMFDVETSDPDYMKVWRFLCANTNINVGISDGVNTNALNASAVCQLNSWDSNACGSLAYMFYDILRHYYGDIDTMRVTAPAHEYSGLESIASIDIGYRWILYKALNTPATLVDIDADKYLWTEPLKYYWTESGFDVVNQWATIAENAYRATAEETFVKNYTPDDLYMRLPAGSYAELPYKSLNTFYFYNGNPITNVACCGITSPIGSVGTVEMPFILASITGTGSVRVAGVTYNLPTDQNALLNFLRAYADWYKSYVILTNTGGIIAEYIVNTKRIKLLTSNTVEVDVVSGRIFYSPVATSKPIDTYSLTVSASGRRWTDDFLRYFTGNTTIKKAVSVPWTFCGDDFIFFEDTDNDGKRSYYQAFTYKTNGGTKTITAGTETFGKCYASILTPKVDTITEATLFTLTAVDGSTCYYTTDGSTPDATKTLYTTPFLISGSTTVKWINIKANWENSCINSRLLTFVTGVLGDELVDQANWYKITYWNDPTNGANWSTIGTALVSNGSSGSYQKYGFLEVGKYYRIIVNITRVSGTVYPFWDGIAPLGFTSSGFHTVDFICGANNPFMYSTLFNGSVNSVSIREIL